MAKRDALSHVHSPGPPIHNHPNRLAFARTLLLCPRVFQFKSLPRFGMFYHRRVVCSLPPSALFPSLKWPWLKAPSTGINWRNAHTHSYNLLSKPLVAVCRAGPVFGRARWSCTMQGFLIFISPKASGLPKWWLWNHAPYTRSLDFLSVYIYQHPALFHVPSLGVTFPSVPSNNNGQQQSKPGRSDYDCRARW